MKKLYRFNQVNLKWNMTTFTNNIQLALVFASEAENDVPVCIFDDDDKFYRGANGPVLSYATKKTDKYGNPIWRTRQINNPIQAREAWAQLVKANLTRRWKLGPIDHTVKSGQPDNFEIELPVPSGTNTKQEFEAAQAESIQKTQQIGKHAAKTESAETTVRTTTRRTGRLQRHQAAQQMQGTEQPPWDTDDKQPNVLTAAEAQLAMANMSIPAQMVMQLAKSGQIEAPEMPKFNEKDLPPVNYENFNYDDLADMDPAPAVKQPIKQPVAKPVVKQPVAVTTPDYSDAYDNYLPPYPTEEDDASWGMF